MASMLNVVACNKTADESCENLRDSRIQLSNQFIDCTDQIFIVCNVDDFVQDELLTVFFIGKDLRQWEVLVRSQSWMAVIKWQHRVLM
jgi:hypothetical protein